MTTVKQHKRSYANFLGSIGGVPQAPANTEEPSIAGVAQVGQVLTADDGAWSGRPAPTFTRTWQADGVVIEGATSTTYTPISEDVGKVITVTVTATNSEGSGSATSAATAAVIEAA